MLTGNAWTSVNIRSVVIGNGFVCRDGHIWFYVTYLSSSVESVAVATFNIHRQIRDQEISYSQIVQTTLEKAPDCIIGRGDNWLFVHVKTRIDDTRNAGYLLVFVYDLVV